MGAALRLLRSLRAATLRGSLRSTSRLRREFSALRASPLRIASPQTLKGPAVSAPNNKNPARFLKHAGFLFLLPTQKMLNAIAFLIPPLGNMMNAIAFDTNWGQYMLNAIAFFMF